jgi:ribosomal protein S4E
MPQEGMMDHRTQGNVADGDRCEVVAGTHRGKTGTVQDRKLSKTGHATITVRQDSGVCFKTLARNAEKR